MSDELTIKKERVLEAAEQCSDARSILETIFPEAFEETARNITDEIEVEMEVENNKGNPRGSIRLYYGGKYIGHVRNADIVTCYSYITRRHGAIHFQVWKK